MKRLLLLITLLVIASAMLVTSSVRHETALALHAMPCGDMDADGMIETGLGFPTDDFDLLMTYFGVAGPPGTFPADLNGDGAIVGPDVFILLGMVSGMATACQDTPVGPGPDAGLAADYDADGCTNVEEMGAIPLLGGGRDIFNHWDFMDVTGDDAVAGNDFFAVLGRFGAVDPTPGKVDPPFTPIPPPPAYHSSFDRSAAVAPFFPVDVGPPEGAIAGLEFFVALAQFGTAC
jgi:hypothetical protein